PWLLCNDCSKLVPIVLRMTECVDFPHIRGFVLWHNDLNAQLDRHLGCTYTNAALLRIFPQGEP
ncbi:MAG: hypothetical protein RLZZ371_1143, partial [Pseudomonadota bacterium]